MKNVNNLVAIYQTSTYVDNSDCLINVTHNGFTSAVSESYITELRKHPEWFYYLRNVPTPVYYVFFITFILSPF